MVSKKQSSSWRGQVIRAAIPGGVIPAAEELYEALRVLGPSRGVEVLGTPEVSDDWAIAETETRTHADAPCKYCVIFSRTRRRRDV